MTVGYLSGTVCHEKAKLKQDNQEDGWLAHEALPFPKSQQAEGAVKEKAFSSGG